MNIGTATGSLSSLAVLDTYTKQGRVGTASLTELEEKYGKLPSTLEARIASGGQQELRVGQ